MTHIKRGAALLLCLCMALSLCACGGKGGEDTEADTPPSDGPLPLSQYIQSSETQILYETDHLDKDTRPEIHLFQDGTVISLKRKFTFGELSKMSDEEIIQAVMTAEEPLKCEPCTVYLETDSTGNAVKKEILLTYDPWDQDCGDVEFNELFPENGVIYDSTYTGYWNQRRECYYVARGEQAPFVLDEIGAGGVEIDPGPESDLIRSFAWIELIDGTRVSLPENYEDGIVTSYTMTEGGPKTLSLDEIQFIMPDQQLDYSPSALQTPEGRAALTSQWYGHNVPDLTSYESGAIPAHKGVSFTNGMVQVVTFCNTSDTEQALQDLTLGSISVQFPTSTEGRTGPFEDNIDTLIREYGSPSGAVMQWEERTHDSFRYPHSRILYYWAGDGFYILTSMYTSSRGQILDVTYTKSGLSGQDLETAIPIEVLGILWQKADRQRVCEEINRQLAS